MRSSGRPIRPIMPLALSPAAMRRPAGENLWDALALAVCYGASSLPAVVLPADRGFFSLRYALVIGSVGYLFWRTWRHVPARSLSLRDPLYLSWCGFGFCAVLAGVANDLPTFFQGVWLLFVLPLFFFALLPRFLKEKTSLFAGLSLGLVFLLFNLVSVVLKPDLSYPYQGVWDNSNYIGILAATQAAGCFAILPAVLEHPRWRVCTLPLLGLLGIALAFILISGSRTSLMAFCAPLALLQILWLRQKGVRALVATALLALTIILLIFATGLHDRVFELAQGIIAKQERAQLDPLSGRADIWRTTLDESRWLGHGFGYFPETFGHGPHNVIIGVLGNYGILAAIFISLFGALSLWRAWLHAWRHMREDPFAAAPLAMVAAYWVLAMGEASGALGGGLSLAFYTCAGVLLSVEEATPLEAFQAAARAVRRQSPTRAPKSILHPKTADLRGERT